MTEQELWKFWEERECVEYVRELKKGRFLPFIGAGMSVDFGYPTWPSFLQNVIERYASPPEQEQLGQLLAEQAFLPLAEALDQDLQNGIEEVVQRYFHPGKMKEVEPAQNYVKLLQNMGIQSYVTTNYDTVLERHDPEAGKKVILPTTLQSTGEFEELERRGQPFLLKLHGTYDNPDSIVLAQRQYEKHYPQDENAVNPAVLRRLWQHETLLFLGCSLEKDYLVERMLQLSGENRRIHHYAILEWPQLPERQQERERELLRLKIRPIWYPQGDHSCVCTILTMLAEGKGGPEPAKRLDPGGAASKPSARLKPASWGDILPAKDFLGRETKKQELAEELRTSDLVFLSGVGGIGKSELAAQYARDQAKAGKTVVRMFYHPGEPKAEDPVEASGLRKLLLNLTILDDPAFADLPPEEGAARMQYYQGKLQRLKQLCNPNTLLVIDNFDVENDDGLKELQELGAQVILTTRQDFRPHFAQVDIEALKEEDAYRLFLRHASLGKDDREEEARELIRQVEGHTTAVILLAAQKEADGFTTGQLLKRLTQGLRQAGESSVRLRKDGKLLEDENAFRLLCAVLNAAELPPEERKLLANLSLLGPQGIAPGNLCQWCGLPNRNSLNKLVKLHWVEQAENRVFLSPVISQVAFETVGACFAVCGLFLQSWSQWYEGISREEQHLWRKTLQTVGTNVLLLIGNEEVQELAEGTAFVLHHLGVQCYKQALRLQSEKLYGEALRLYQDLAISNLDEYELDVAMTRNDLAVLLSGSTERREEAKKLYQEALELYQKRSEDNSSVYEPYVATIYNNLAILLTDSQERRGKAEELYREALELYQKLAAAKPSVYEPYVATVYNNLATLLADSQERREEAERLYREALKLYRNLAKVNPSVYEPDVAMICSNLAGLLSNSTDEQEEAEELYWEALKLRQKLAAANPSVYEPHVAATCSNLAVLLEKNPGRCKKAEKLYREALALYRKQVRIAPKIYQPELTRVCWNLGELLQFLGRTEEAEALFREAKGE